MKNISKTERLYRAIGEIDDMFIQEAIIYEKTRFSVFDYFRKPSAVIAVLLIVFISLFTLNNHRTESDIPSNDMQSSLTLTEVLSSASGEYHASKSEIDLFDGTAKFVYYDGSCYKTVQTTLSPSYLAKNLTLDEAPNEEISDIRIWYSIGDGRVISPYLKLSEGNVGYNELFEYQPEGTPSSEFTQMVNNCL